MNISSYIKENRLTQKKFGALVGVSPGMVWQWIALEKGRPGRLARVTAEKAIEIEKATNGLVSREELRPDIFMEAA